MAGGQFYEPEPVERMSWFRKFAIWQPTFRELIQSRSHGVVRCTFRERSERNVQRAAALVERAPACHRKPERRFGVALVVTKQVRSPNHIDQVSATESYRSFCIDDTTPPDAHERLSRIETYQALCAEDYSQATKVPFEAILQPELLSLSILKWALWASILRTN